MKVVHISSSISGGAGAAAYRLHSALLAEGVESVMLTRWDNIEEQHIYAYKRPLLAKIMERIFPPIGRLSYVKYKDDLRKYNAPNFPYALYNLAKSKEIQTADIINLHWVGNMLNYRSFFRSVSAPVVWTMHDLNPILGLTHYIMGDDDRIKNDKSLSGIDSQAKFDKKNAYKCFPHLSVACLSSYVYELSVNSDTFRNKKHFMVKNCVDVKTHLPKDKALMRDKWNIPLDAKVIMYISQGVRDERKGFSYMKSATERSKMDCLFLTVGYSAGITKENVRELGYISDEKKLSEIYSCADALLLPSLEDNLPNTMLEALSCGVPIIAFPVGGMVDIIQHGKNGLLTSEISSEALVGSIESFLMNGVEWDSQSIAENACSLFSPSVVAKEYIRIYNELTNDK